MPVNESDAADPISPYADSKFKGESFCLGLNQRQLLKSVVLRLFNVYGPRQGLNEYSGVITKFFDRCRQELPLTVYGDGSQTRDFVHVYDVADAMLKASEQSRVEGQIFNIGSGKATSIRELACAVSKICGRPENVAYADPRPGDIKHSFADVSKAERLLGYRPSYSLEMGLRTLADGLSERIV